LERELGLQLRGAITVAPRGQVWVSSWGRPRLGVVVKTARDVATDSIGAVLQAVTPGGPSEKAGLKAGDILTKLNGESLVGRYPPASPDESEPGIKLVDLARELDEGDTARIEYRRGGETRTATVIAEILEPEGMPLAMALDTAFRLRMAPRIEVEPMRELSRTLAYALPNRWLDMELVGLNPELGSYFGTTDGVLVVRGPSDESLRLQSGDVILRIGSREPTSAAHALRILRSYDAGETVSIVIMRQKQRQTIEAVVPERSSRYNFYFGPEQNRLRTGERVIIRAPRRDS
jgi:S1-C subfamily serine protease